MGTTDDPEAFDIAMTGGVTTLFAHPTNHQARESHDQVRRQQVPNALLLVRPGSLCTFQ